MLHLHAVQVNDPCEVLGGRDLLHGALQQKAVGAAVDEYLPSHQFVDELRELLVHGRFAACDGHDGRAGVLHGLEALIEGEGLGQHGQVLADASAPVTVEVAGFQGFEHGHQREPLSTTNELLRDGVGEGSPCQLKRPSGADLALGPIYGQRLFRRLHGHVLRRRFRNCHRRSPNSVIYASGRRCNPQRPAAPIVPHLRRFRPYADAPSEGEANPLAVYIWPTT